MADGHFYDRQALQHIINVDAANEQSAEQQKLRSRNQPHGQHYVLQIMAHISCYHEPFFLQVTQHQDKHQEAVGDVVNDLQPYAELPLLPEVESHEGQKHGKQDENPQPTRDKGENLDFFRLTGHRWK